MLYSPTILYPPTKPTPKVPITTIMDDDDDGTDSYSSEASMVASDEDDSRKPIASSSIDEPDKYRHEPVAVVQEQQATTTAAVIEAETGKDQSSATMAQQLGEKGPVECQPKRTGAVSSSDGDTRNDDGARSESTVNAAERKDSPGSSGCERAKRKLVESVLEQKRRASRESSRRSQERQRKQIEHLTQEEIRLQNLNQTLRRENHNFRQARGALQEALDARLQHQQQQERLVSPTAAVNPAIAMLQQLATAAAQFQPQPPHQPSPIIQNTPEQHGQNNPGFNLVDSLQHQMNAPVHQHQQYQQHQQHPYQINPGVQNLSHVVVPQTSSGGMSIQQPAPTIPATAQTSPDQLMLQDLLRVSSQTAHHELLQVLSHFVNNMVSQSTMGQASQLPQAQPAAQLQSLLALLCVLNVVLNQQTTQSAQPSTGPAASSSHQSMSQQQGQGYALLPSFPPTAPSHTTLMIQQPHQHPLAMPAQQQHQPQDAHQLQNQFATSFSPLVQQLPLQSPQASTLLHNQLAMIMNSLTQHTGQSEQQTQLQQQHLQHHGQNTLSLLGSFSNQELQQPNRNLQTTTTTTIREANEGIVHTGNQPLPSSSSSPISYMGNSASNNSSQQQQQKHHSPSHHGA